MTLSTIPFWDKAFSQARDVNHDTLERVVTLAVELAREGREGRKVGTMFVISDAENVLVQSRPLILDPLLHHADELKHLNNPNMWETVKELSQLDGAFIVSDDGVVISACRYLNASSEGVELPMGLGSRHMAAASITLRTTAVTVVVSESSIVRLFDDGQIVSEIIPELWLLKRYGTILKAHESQQRSIENITVVDRGEPK
jgi:DNA integrity scanning protein DisA with diadenylate cyclase activity